MRTRYEQGGGADGFLVRVVLCDHEDEIGILMSKSHNLLSVLQVMCNRFLNDHMLALRERRAAYFVVELYREGYHHGVHILLMQVSEEAYLLI